jgi:RNA polymerase sigma-70 factor (ECF subfamily)
MDDLLRRIRSGDRDAYSALVREHQDMLLAFAAFRVPDPALVDEVVQQTFIRAWDQIRDYDPSKDFGTWLRTICRFMILAELKRAGRERHNQSGYLGHLRGRLLEEAAVRGEAGPDEDLLRRLKSCLGKLQDRSRDLVRQRYEELLRVEEIARRTGQSAAWVATTLFRVRDTLRKCLEAGA